MRIMATLRGAINCTICSIGYYSDTAGSTSCTACPAGKYANLDTSSTCYTCPKNYYGTATGATSFAAGCTQCASGKSSIPGSTSCVTGPPTGFTHPLLLAFTGDNNVGGPVASKAYLMSPTTGENLGTICETVFIRGNRSALLGINGCWEKYDTGTQICVTTDSSPTYRRSIVRFQNIIDCQAELRNGPLIPAFMALTYDPEFRRLLGYHPHTSLPGDNSPNTGIFSIPYSGTQLLNQAATLIGDQPGSYMPGSASWLPASPYMGKILACGSDVYCLFRCRTLGSFPQIYIELISNTTGAPLVSKFVPFKFTVNEIGWGCSEITPTPNQDAYSVALTLNKQKTRYYRFDVVLRNLTYISTILNYTTSIVNFGTVRNSAELSWPASCTASNRCTIYPKLYCNATTNLCTNCPVGKKVFDKRVCV
jgi:hypothetical protein